jgi:hypothetical protein
MRLYLNCFGDMPFVWSIDEGTIETKQKFAAVTLLGVKAKTASDANARGDSPKVWLEFDGVLRKSPDGSAIVEPL